MVLNSFNALPVPQNPILEKRILNLSPIGKKLAGPYRVLGRHLGFWPIKNFPKGVPVHLLHSGPKDPAEPLSAKTQWGGVCF